MVNAPHKWIKKTRVIADIVKFFCDQMFSIFRRSLQCQRVSHALNFFFIFFFYHHGLLCCIPYTSPTPTVSNLSAYPLKMSEQAAVGDLLHGHLGGRPLWNVCFVAKVSVMEHLQKPYITAVFFILFFLNLTSSQLDIKAKF